MARSVVNAPKQITWIIALVLYVVALLGTFGVVPQITGQITQWSWIIGFGLVLVATKVKNLWFDVGVQPSLRTINGRISEIRLIMHAD
jgi:protein-S-isoprenylcysteine O-methyltransferase Ste14